MRACKRFLVWCVFALVVAVTAACQKTAIPIEGLTLPPGARVVEQSKVGSRAAVAFDTNAEWDEVKAHFDSVLTKLGYSEDFQKQELISKIKSKHPDWSEARVEKAYQTTKAASERITEQHGSRTASYVNPNEPYGVILLEMAGFREFAISKGETGREIAKLGNYSLAIFPKEDLTERGSTK